MNSLRKPDLMNFLPMGLLIQNEGYRLLALHKSTFLRTNPPSLSHNVSMVVLGGASGGNILIGASQHYYVRWITLPGHP